MTNCKFTHFIHWPQSQHLFLWHWGHGARAPVVQTIIIWAGSKKSHVPQFTSAVIAWRNGWFRIWNKLRNHFLCTALIHLSPDTQTFRACFLSNWHGRQVSNIQGSRKGFFFFLLLLRYIKMQSVYMLTWLQQVEPIDRNLSMSNRGHA